MPAVSAAPAMLADSAGRGAPAGAGAAAPGPPPRADASSLYAGCATGAAAALADRSSANHRGPDNKERTLRHFVGVFGAALVYSKSMAVCIWAVTLESKAFLSGVVMRQTHKQELAKPQSCMGQTTSRKTAAAENGKTVLGDARNFNAEAAQSFGGNAHPWTGRPRTARRPPAAPQAATGLNQQRGGQRHLPAR